MEDVYTQRLLSIAWIFCAGTLAYFTLTLIIYFFKGKSFFETYSDKLFGASLFLTVPTAICFFVESVRTAVLQAFVIFCFVTSLDLFRRAIIQRFVVRDKPIDTIIHKKQQAKKKNKLKQPKVTKTIRRKHVAPRRSTPRSRWFRRVV